MSPNKTTPITLAMLLLFLVTCPAYSGVGTTIPISNLLPKRIIKNPALGALEVGVVASLTAVGWVMTEGTKVKKLSDNTSDTSTSDTTSDTSTDTTSIEVPATAQTYPLEYTFDGKSFGSAESACQYVFDSYLTKQGLKKTRTENGKYSESVNVYIGSNYYNSAGHFVCSTQVGSIDTDYPHNVGGMWTTYYGNILYKGTQRVTHVNISEAYKKRREEAKKAIEQAIAQAQALPVPETDLPNVKPLPLPVPDDLPAVVPNNPAKPETEPQTKPETKPDTKPKPDTKFCQWARTFCDFMDWVKQEPPKPPPPEQLPKADLSDLGIDDNRFQKRVHFLGECPSGNFEFSANGLFFSKPIPYYHFCDLLIKLKPWLLAFVYLSSAYFVVSNL